MGRVLLFSVGCVSNPPAVINGSANGKAGLATLARSGESTAVAVSPKGRVGEWRGVALRHTVLLGLIQWGDNSVGTAAQKAAPSFSYRNDPHIGIREIDTVATGGVKILWGLLYCNEQTVVTGRPEPKVVHPARPRDDKR